MTIMPYYPWPDWKDAVGQTFKAGDFVAYAYTSGRSGALQFGIVLEINRYRKNGEEIIQRIGWDSTNKQPINRPSCTVTVTPVNKTPAGPNGDIVWTDRKTKFVSGPAHVITTEPNQKKTWQQPWHILKIDPIELAQPNDF